MKVMFNKKLLKVMKYADNIIKGFATSISIIFSSLVSYLIFNDLVINT